MTHSISRKSSREFWIFWVPFETIKAASQNRAKDPPKSAILIVRCRLKMTSSACQKNGVIPRPQSGYGNPAPQGNSEQFVRCPAADELFRVSLITAGAPCKTLRIRRSRLFRLSRELCGCGMGQQLRKLRMEKARQLLSDRREMSITGIGAARTNKSCQRENGSKS